MTDRNSWPSRVPLATLQAAAAADGNGETLDVAGYGVTAFWVSGTFTATVNFEATFNNTDWFALYATNQASGTRAATTTATGYFVASTIGLSQVRARISSHSLGTVTVEARALMEPIATQVSASVSGGAGAVTLADGAHVTFGAQADAAASTDTATGTAMSLLKRMLQRLTTLIGLFPASLGTKAAANSLAVTLASDENVLVGGRTASLAPTITVGASPNYDAGDCVGGKITLSNAVRVSGGTGVLHSLLIKDASNQKPALEILFFNADPSAATLTDNDALALSTDLSKVIRRVSIAATDYVTVDSKAIADLRNVGGVLKAASGTTLYMAIMATGTINFAATTDLSVTPEILQD